MIDPESCIDCTLCVAECPVDAIYPEDDVPGGQEQFLAINAELAPLWPVIDRKKPALPDAADMGRRAGQAEAADPLGDR